MAKRRKVRVGDRVYRFMVVGLGGRTGSDICKLCSYYTEDHEFGCSKFLYPDPDIEDEYKTSFQDFCADIEEYLACNGDYYYSGSKLTLIPCRGTLEENEKKNNKTRREEI